MVLGRNNKYSVSHSVPACLLPGLEGTGKCRGCHEKHSQGIKNHPKCCCLKEKLCGSSASFQETLSFFFRAKEQGEATPDSGGSAMCSIARPRGEEGQPSCPGLYSPWQPGVLLICQSWYRFSQGSCVTGTDHTLTSLGKGFYSWSVGGQACRAAGLIPFPGAASRQEVGNQQLAKINQPFSLWTELVWHQKSQRPPSASSRASKESRRGDPAGSRTSPVNEPADSYPGFPSAASRYHEGVPEAKMGRPCEMWGLGTP